MKEANDNSQQYLELKAANHEEVKFLQIKTKFITTVCEVVHKSKINMVNENSMRRGYCK